MPRSLFIFRRDLRLTDNTGLLKALVASDEVVPAFIFDPRQIKDNPYLSLNALQFLVESLHEINVSLEKKGGRLYVFEGEPHLIVPLIINELSIKSVCVNRDYTPFSIHRDLALKHACEKASATFESCGDYLLHEPEDVHKPDGRPYTIFTPFFRRCQTLTVRTTAPNRRVNYALVKSKYERSELLGKLIRHPNAHLGAQPGRQAGLKILKDIMQFKNYADERNRPDLDSTTRLSAHLKFGTVSVREVFHAVKSVFGKSHPLINEIYWRDFFTHIGFHFPHVLGEAFQEKYARMTWPGDAQALKAWQEGRTGFPIVDAGMRELNATGFMHNRVRMITASFLVKDLHVDWREGERYFAQTLVDYDPLVNNGNWQWAASTGCDAQPYFRIFNPWLQQKKFDHDCVYIKRWVPELRKISAKTIHGLADHPQKVHPDYPEPILDHGSAAEKAKNLYKVRAG